MNKRLYLALCCIVIVIVGIAALFGLSKRDSYKNPMDDLGSVRVCQFYEGINKLLTEDFGLKQMYIDKSDYILKIKPVSAPDLNFQTYSIDCEVIKVFKQDEEINVGDTIKVTFDGYYFFEDVKSFNIGFANFMNTGYEYLIFVHDKLVTEVYDFPIYRIEAWSLAPIFNYSDLKNVIVEDTMDVLPSGSKYYCYYSDVEENEYFVMNRNLEKQLYEFKYDILSTIDSEYIVPDN